ncbi:hypothetical protein M3Y94_01013700 [Aphelenchoides besseyi]|nr:hypothetical protein M3Y94_01013700 [Aphelenchoides besseyi]KAI6220516.1 hypothetical protein M3Y95_01048500 [Aphelenchoides besseyi]
MADVQRPKLLPQAAAAFFHHFVCHDSEVKPLPNRKLAMRLLNVSKTFCSAAHEFMRNSVLDVRLEPIKSKRPNSWIFHSHQVIMLKEPSAIAVFKLTNPQPKMLFMAEEEDEGRMKIDPVILPYLSDVSKLVIFSENRDPKYSLKFAKKLNSEGKLKIFSCNPEYLAKKQQLKTMTVDKYHWKYDSFEAPFDFASLLKHKFRQVHLEMFLDEDIDIYDWDFDWPVSMVILSKTKIVQPAIEEIYLENLANHNLEEDPPFIPIKCFKHVPNLKKFFYYGHQDAVNDTEYEFGPAIHKLVDRLHDTFNYAKRVRNEGCQAQLIFAFTGKVFLVNDQSEEDWLRDLMRMPVFADVNCKLTTRLELSEDPDFQATPTYDRFCCRCSTAVLICTAPNMKLFLWPSFQELPTFSDDSDSYDDEIYIEFEDEFDEDDESEDDENEDDETDDGLEHQEPKDNSQ